MLAERIADDPSVLQRLKPSELVELTCDRLAAMGVDPQKVRDKTNVRDGGIDVVFTSEYRKRAARNDLVRWVGNHFDDPSDQREIPDEIELCSGFVLKVRG